jgi:hypothetical protein
LTDSQVKTYEDIHPTMPEAFLLNPENWKRLTAEWQRALFDGQAHTFAAATINRDAQILAM